MKKTQRKKTTTMKTQLTSSAAFFNSRILTGFALCSVSLLLALAGLSQSMTGTVVSVPDSTRWYVDGVHGSDSNDCMSRTTACRTIGHAISLAASGDSIVVAAATYIENLTVRISLTITGSGATTTIIDGGAVDRVLAVSSSTANVVLSKFTIRNGKFTTMPGTGGGGGIYNIGILTVSHSIVTGNSVLAGRNLLGGFPANGGGVYNTGTLTITNSTLSANTAVAGGLPQQAAGGGGIYNGGGMLTINRSTLSGNVGVTNDDISGGGAANGGGMYLSGGSTTINDSTLSNNSLAGFHAETGGGIYNGFGGGTLTVNNSTLSNNYCPADGGGIENTLNGTVTIANSTLSGNSTSAGGLGAGISNFEGSVILQNSIVADNFYNGNCYGMMTSNGYNLSSDNTCGFNNTGDLNNTDPILGPLQDNGGPTETQALLSGSRAIDAGDPGGCTDARGRLLNTDQRGMPRPDHEDTSGCDMGAYESQSD
jgi:hypothetical protein